jgi:hypothetical protein
VGAILHELPNAIEVAPAPELTGVEPAELHCFQWVTVRGRDFRAGATKVFLGDAELVVAQIDGRSSAIEGIAPPQTTLGPKRLLLSGPRVGLVWTGFSVTCREAPPTKPPQPAPPPGSFPRFMRGDANVDGIVGDWDLEYILTHPSFDPIGTPLYCLDAADANDDRITSLVDAIAVGQAVQGDLDLLPPGGVCGLDPTPQTSLGCQWGHCPYLIINVSPSIVSYLGKTPSRSKAKASPRTRS